MTDFEVMPIGTVDKIKDLERKLEIAREALRFYGDVKNWKSGYSLKLDDTKMTETSQLRRGGKRARQALKEIEGYDNH